VLNIELCKNILKENGLTLSTEETKAIRDSLYKIAFIEYENSKKNSNDKRSIIHPRINR
jgi:hypothetical protein